MNGFPESDWRTFRELRQIAHERFCKRTLDAFNDPRRSRMIGQLVAIYSSGLLESDEVERFSERTRATIESLAKEFGR